MKTNFTFSIIRRFLFTLIAAIFVLNVVGQTTHNVTVSNYSFNPSQLTINAGDKVIWTNTLGSHNVNGTQATFPTNPESFGNTVGSGWTYEYVFNTPGTYDYQCDPHAAMGMNGTIVVNGALQDTLKLKINFTAMTPHIGQTLWLAVLNQDTTVKDSVEVGRVKHLITAADFSLEVPGIKKGKSYNVDFYADLNKNGKYDAPPADHAWRLPLTSVTGDATLDFAHNTNFTDVKWKKKLTVHFTAMTPHVGQMLTLYVRDNKGKDLDTVIVTSVAAPEFDVSSWAIDSVQDYRVDFFADLNKNGKYDAPPADHAWRITLDSLASDTIVNFVHNTNFTDIFAATASKELAQGSFRLYPNPASDYVDLLFSGDKGYSAVMKIYSVSGSLLKQKMLPQGTQSYRVDLNGLNKGLYFMEISAGNKTTVVKFLKN
jgi:plastocyanin